MTMNSSQKLLTYGMVALLGISTLLVPWDMTNGMGHSNVTRYAPLFFPPDFMYWQKRELASSVFWVWGLLAVSYGLLMWAFHGPALLQENRRNEDPV